MQSSGQLKSDKDALRFLLTASSLLAESLDYQTTLQCITQLVVPTLADWCSVHLIDEQGTIQEVATAHAESRNASIDALRQQPTPVPAHLSAIADVLKTGQREFISEIPDSLLVASARDADHLRLLREAGIASMIAMPLIAHSRTFGVMTFIATRARQPFTEADLELTEELGRRIALAVDNARLYRQADQQRAYYLTTLASIADVVVTTDIQGHVTFMNPVAEALTGWTFAEAKDAPLDQVFRIVDKHTQVLGENLITRVLQDGAFTGLAGNATLIARDATEYAIDGSGSPLYGQLGEVTGVVLVLHDITERQQTENLLTRYKLLFEYARDILLFVGMDARIIEANHAAQMAYGYTHDELCSMTIYDLRDSTTSTSVSSQMQQADYEGILFETRHRRKDGSSFPVEVNSRGAEFHGKQVLLSVIRDISRRRNMELASTQLAAIVASSEDAIIGKTLDGYIFTWNAAAERLYGYTAADIEGKHISLLAPPDRTDEIPEILKRLRRGEHISRFETVRVRKDGSRVDISLSISPIKRDDGSISGAATIARDITDRKRIEFEQRFLAQMSILLDRTLDYQATLQSIVELLVPTLADYCIMYIVDTDGGYKQAAARHRDPVKSQMLTGLNQIYRPDETVVPSLAVEVMRSNTPIIQVAATPPPALMHNPEALSIYQQLAPITYIVVPLNAYGNIRGTIMLATAESGRRYAEHDVKLAEEVARRCSIALENARLYQEAQEAIRIRDEFLTVAAHELRTPITGLIGYSQVMQRWRAQAQSNDERDQRALRVIIEQSERLKRLVDTLLDVSNIQSGPFSLQRKPIDLCTLAQRIVEQRQMLLNRHNIVLECEEASLPINGDEERLEQVFQNLIQNAVKFSPDGGQITIRIQRQDEMILMAVSDEGIGIPAAAQANLFQRYYRANNATTHQIGGFGIGLYLVKEIISRHDGTIEVFSAEGEGTTFTITFPALQP